MRTDLQRHAKKTGAQPEGAFGAEVLLISGEVHQFFFPEEEQVLKFQNQVKSIPPVLEINSIKGNAL
jgi:hypothetical protein